MSAGPLKQSRPCDLTASSSSLPIRSMDASSVSMCDPGLWSRFAARCCSRPSPRSASERTTSVRAPKTIGSLRENSALQSEYDSLLLTADERAQQLESIGNPGLPDPQSPTASRGDQVATDAAYGAEMEVAYYASLGQYGQLRTVLSDSDSGVRSSAMLANGKPSIWPVKGHLSSGYGTRQDPFHGKGTFHPGIDISAPRGTPVVATADGFVTYASWERGLGHCVKIQHGRQGYRTIYGHLKEYFVREGQFVTRGEVIGRVGSSGRTTGNHVHYEVHHNRLRMNPAKFLRSRDRTYEVSLAD